MRKQKENSVVEPTITLCVSDEGPQFDWSSKIGGYPYLVDAERHPLDSAGNPLAFIAQLNFTDLPSLPGYPTVGLLQFFISTSVARPFEHRVLYHSCVPTEQIRRNQTLPVRTRTALPLGADGWPVPWSDDEFNPIVHPDNEYALIGNSTEPQHRTRGHRVGGPAYFNQGGELPRGHVLLLQLDSEPHEFSAAGYRILWGDLGTARFSIDPNDLTQKNFTDTEYHWDNT